MRRRTSLMPETSPNDAAPPVEHAAERNPLTAALPVKVRLPEAPRIFGISRSAIYRGAADGHICLSKLGRGTLVDTASVLKYLENLPAMTPKAAA